MFLNHLFTSVIGKQDLESQNCSRGFLYENPRKEKKWLFTGSTDSLSMIFHINMNFGTEIWRYIITTTYLVLVFISKPCCLYIPEEEIQMSYFASLWFQVAALRSYWPLYRILTFSLLCWPKGVTESNKLINRAK